MLKGRLELRTGADSQVYEAGQAFYWPPGHVPEALEDCEFVDFSPTVELDRVISRITSQGCMPRTGGPRDHRGPPVRGRRTDGSGRLSRVRR